MSMLVEEVDGSETARLVARVSELEHLLQLERSRNKGLERGLSALSDRAVTLRKAAQPLPAATRHPAA